jgi:hypothetical protein
MKGEENGRTIPKSTGSSIEHRTLPLGQSN